MNQYIEKLIAEDIATIDNKGVRTKREKALRSYYSTPKYCLCCGNLIIVTAGMKIADAKQKKFCGRSCSATYNNTVVKRGRMQQIAQACSDEDFIKAYNESESYAQLGSSIGYSFIGSSVSKKIKARMKQLNLPEYESCNRQSIAGMTKGELIKSRSNWQSWRSSIQRQARANYQNSGKPKCCAICGYDKAFEVAHINPVSEFSNDALLSEVNSIDNLMALCPNHHWEYDHLGLCLSEYIS